MWSWVTRIARAPNSSASAIAIGSADRIEDDDVAVVRKRDEPAPQVGDVDHGGIRIDVVRRQPSARAGALHDHGSPLRNAQLLAEADAHAASSDLAFEPLDDRTVRAGDGREAAQTR